MSHPPESHEDGPAPIVSVVVPSCNRSGQLRRCLEALALQTHQAFEVIVIDDGSTDDTGEMVGQVSRDHPGMQLRYLRNERNLGANPSRNRGIAASRGAFVAFLDSDCVAEPEWLDRLVAGFSDDRIAAVTGLVHNQPSANIYELAYRGTQRLHRRGPAHRLVGCNMCVRREFLLGAMLDEDRAGSGSTTPDVTVSGRGDEEGLFLMIRASGLNAMVVPDAVVLHEHHYGRRSFFKQARRGGQSAARLVYKYHLPPRLDLLPFILAYLTLPLMFWQLWLAPVPLAFFAAACAAVAYNEISRKGKSLGETIRIFPVQLAYYHLRLFGYVTESLRLRLTGHEIARVRLSRHAAEPPRVNHFHSTDLAEGLGRKAMRAGALSGAGHAGQFLLMSAGTVVLARLLTPEDYGLVTMVTAVIAMVAGFKDLGLASLTVQRPEITHQQTSALFWVNVAFGLFLMVVVSAAAPALAWFYGEPRVLWMTVAMASTFLVSGLAVQHHSLLRRQLRFGEVAGIELCATLLAVSGAIAAAMNGAEYWSLVLMYVLTQVFITAGAWLRCSWRPGRPARAAGVRAMLAYGGYLTGFNIVHSFLRSFDRILIGWAASAGPLGLYSRASFLVGIPTQRLSNAATGVAISVLSRLQHEPERYRAFVLTATLLFGSLAIPLGAFAFAAADSIVLVVLGTQWAAAAPILRALAPTAAFATFETAAMWVSASTGQTRRQFQVGVAAAIGSIAAMIAGLQWGVTGVAVGFSAATAIAWTAGLVYCLQPLSVTIADFLSVLWRPALAAAIAAAVTIGVGAGGFFGSAVLLLAAQTIAFTAAYAACWLLLPRGRATVKEMLSHLSTYAKT